MGFSEIASIAAAIVAVAGVMVVVTSPYTAGIITSGGGAFVGALKAATGR